MPRSLVRSSRNTHGESDSTTFSTSLKFIEAAHVKDMVAVLRLLENPHDELSWFRVLLLLEAVGPVSARRVIAELGVGGAPPPPARPQGTPLMKLVHQPPSVPPPARDSFAELRHAVGDCLKLQKSKPVPLGVQIERIRKFYEPICQRIYDQSEVRLRDIDQLVQIASGYESRGEFIADLTLDPPVSTQDLAGKPLLDEDYLILSTMHSAKGCEWRHVHIIHAADGMIPSDLATSNEAEIEEERRLLYVAMTRARDELRIYFPLRYYHSGRPMTDRHTYAQMTRFVAPSTLHHYEQISVSVAEAPPPLSAHKEQIAVPTIDESLNRLWRS